MRTKILIGIIVVFIALIFWFFPPVRWETARLAMTRDLAKLFFGFAATGLVVTLIMHRSK